MVKKQSCGFHADWLLTQAHVLLEIFKLLKKLISFYDVFDIFLVLFHYRCHLPLLFVGLEHGQTKNFRLAEKFFSQALAIAPNDPFVLHEMGVAAFHNAE